MFPRMFLEIDNSLFCYFWLLIFFRKSSSSLPRKNNVPYFQFFQFRGTAPPTPKSSKISMSCILSQKYQQLFEKKKKKKKKKTLLYIFKSYHFAISIFDHQVSRFPVKLNNCPLGEVDNCPFSHKIWKFDGQKLWLVNNKIRKYIIMC